MTTVTITGGVTRVNVGGATKRITLARSTVAQIANHRPTTAVHVHTSSVMVGSGLQRVTAGSAMGAQGPPGLDGADGGQSINRTAATALGGHRVVRSTAASTVGYADATNTEHGDDTVGITVGAAAEDAEVEVQRTGSLTFGGWSWTQGLPVFLSTNGTLTQTPPDDTHAFSQIVGHAESATALFIQIEPPIYY